MKNYILKLKQFDFNDPYDNNLQSDHASVILAHKGSRGRSNSNIDGGGLILGNQRPFINIEITKCILGNYLVD